MGRSGGHDRRHGTGRYGPGRLSDHPGRRHRRAGSRGPDASRNRGMGGSSGPCRRRIAGDNLYPSGLEEANRAWGESILRQQLEATTALRIFVPGNHDWGSSPGDWTGERVIAQQEFILDWREGDVDFLPRDGCPGPAVRELLRPGEAMERGIAIVAIDWLPWFSEVHDSSRCAGGEFGQRIDDVFASLENHHVIVASHYPLRSAGARADLGRGMLMDILANLYHLFKPRSELNLYHPQYVVYAEQVRKPRWRKAQAARLCRGA